MGARHWTVGWTLHTRLLHTASRSCPEEGTGRAQSESGLMGAMHWVSNDALLMDHRPSSQASASSIRGPSHNPATPEQPDSLQVTPTKLAMPIHQLARCKWPNTGHAQHAPASPSNCIAGPTQHLLTTCPCSHTLIPVHISGMRLSMMPESTLSYPSCHLPAEA